MEKTRIEIFAGIVSDMLNDGMHYAFDSKDSYDYVSDEEFHKLRKKYLKAASKLIKYINKQLPNEEMGLYRKFRY